MTPHPLSTNDLERMTERYLAYDFARDLLVRCRSNELADYLSNSNSRWRQALLSRMADEDYILCGRLRDVVLGLVKSADFDLAASALLAYWFGMEAPEILLENTLLEAPHYVRLKEVLRLVA